MKRLTCALFALSFGLVAGCAEQPGKKKEEDTKTEAKTVDGKAAKPEAAPADAKPAAPAPEAK
jgi:hypothetical protein